MSVNFCIPSSSLIHKLAHLTEQYPAYIALTFDEEESVWFDGTSDQGLHLYTGSGDELEEYMLVTDSARSKNISLSLWYSAQTIYSKINSWQMAQTFFH